MMNTAPKTYTVRLTNPTGIPGYEPSYQMATGQTWEQGYEWAMALAKSQADSSPTGSAQMTSFERFYTELRDGATEATLLVFTAQQGITLGRPFTPKTIATITVTAE
jgi:hypothetical protein